MVTTFAAIGAFSISLIFGAAGVYNGFGRNEQVGADLLNASAIFFLAGCCLLIK